MAKRPGAPDSEIHRLAIGQIVAVQIDQHLGEVAVIQQHRELEIQMKTAQIEIDRPEDRQFAIDHHALGMQQATAKPVDPHAGRQQLIEIGGACILDHA